MATFLSLILFDKLSLNLKIAKGVANQKQQQPQPDSHRYFPVWYDTAVLLAIMTNLVYCSFFFSVLCRMLWARTSVSQCQAMLCQLLRYQYAPFYYILITVLLCQFFQPIYLFTYLLWPFSWLLDHPRSCHEAWEPDWQPWYCIYSYGLKRKQVVTNAPLCCKGQGRMHPSAVNVVPKLMFCFHVCSGCYQHSFGLWHISCHATRNQFFPRHCPQ